MKKNIIHLTIIGLVILMFNVACNSNITKSNQDYRKACEEKDFETAYEIVDDLKEITSKAKIEYETYPDIAWKEDYRIKYNAAKEKSDEVEKYVILQESIFVLESQGTNGLIRIVGIAKEHNAEGWLYSELLDIAKKIGDTDLVERIQKMIGRTTITPDTLTITGPLKDYFKIVDKQYTPSSQNNRDLFVEFVRTKGGFPGKDRYAISMVISFLDDNGNILDKDKEKCSEEMYNSNVGETSSTEFSIRKDLKPTKFIISSVKR